MKKHKALWIIIIVYLAAIAILYSISLILNKGEFVYALDDAYIHMSMADNLVNTGNWATNKIDFASASSSPLWVLMISSVYVIFGKNVSAPFILNLMFQLFGILTIYYFLRKLGIVKYLKTFLLLYIFITPFPANLFSGMEHSAQIAFAMIFVFISLKFIAKNEPGGKLLLVLLPVTFLFAGIRYEDLILISLVSLLIFIKGRKLTGLLVFASGLLPLLFYGFFSVSHGSFFIPNTLLLKGSLPGFTAVGLIRFCYRAYTNITEPHIFIMLVIISSLYIYNFKKKKSFWEDNQLMLLVSAVTIIINMSIIDYAHNGAFYRYDAYLMALGIFSVIINIYDIFPEILLWRNSFKNKLIKFSSVLLIFIIASPLIVRAFSAFGIPLATMEYHNQQYQMAQFCRLYAKNMTVAMNDIGMVNYYTDCKVYDLLGLSNIEIAKQRINGTLNTGSIEKLGKLENTRLIMCYENWFDQYGGLPASWKKIGEWTMNDYNFFLGNSTVSIYTTNSDDKTYFKEKLNEYSVNLPRSITSKIY